MISANMVMELREKTGVGMMDCKKALTETGGDFEKALDYLRKKGLATAAKKSGRKASEGLICSYIHMDKIGVMLELNCETDFVAKTDEYKILAKDISMHIAAANPEYVEPSEIPAAVIEREKEIYKDQVKGKPANVVDKIVEGKLEKFYSEKCLVKQAFVKNPDQTIHDLVVEKIAKLGENIVIGRFVRYQLGEKQGES
ncbi:elongation factor Ts [Candidatus Magnetominusculus xianensis]|uniref:Elongation factor Ts n=2 Tax=Candidatus Magnetominusculus xianensis TaxID=1748249 RepID=A0ABR5SDZ7_9BACT|nr:translation elongation factor Ts [Candidatus Magnetominusculus xianensis]KWT83990.1 elongation factor Ts [Candidatus Magnetominusculus xianensis]MBF0405368.1 translation elongation factor Ts [Nitrospirota bacterium]